MKALLISLVSICQFAVLHGQEPLSREEALKQLYDHYDAAKNTANWICVKGQEHAAWPCWTEYSTVSISVLLVAQVQEQGVEKTYLAASAKPGSAPLGYECHACRPAIGVAVFAWKAPHWVLQSANLAVGFFGGWGDPPGVDLVEIGSNKYGVLVSTDDMAQGFAWSQKHLFINVATTIDEVWSIQDEQDNLGAVDSDDKLNKEVAYRSSAAFRFSADYQEANSSSDYFDIEVISRGTDREDYSHPLKQENWTEVYRFSNGKYRLLRHTDFVETKNDGKKSPR